MAVQTTSNLKRLLKNVKKRKRAVSGRKKRRLGKVR